jgi:hypothetical protein
LRAEQAADSVQLRGPTRPPEETRLIEVALGPLVLALPAVCDSCAARHAARGGARTPCWSRCAVPGDQTAAPPLGWECRHAYEGFYGYNDVMRAARRAAVIAYLRARRALFCAFAPGFDPIQSGDLGRGSITP